MNYPRNIFREFNDEKLNEIRNHPYYKEIREKIIKKADDILETPLPRIRFSELHMYVTTGNRNIFQSNYNKYHYGMEYLFQAYLITEDEKYLPELADIIWNICNFESWTVPAHVDENLPIKERRRFLDLASTALARDMSEVIYYIGDKLPELVTRRAKAELQYRIIDSYAERDWPFEFVKHNWASVCMTGVLCVYLNIATDEEIEAQLPRMMKVIDLYLSGFEDDGCCSEGISYWNYGFQNFLIFASMLKDYTDGRINYFDNPKVKKVASFPYRVILDDNNNCLTFSDASVSRYNMDNWVAHTIKANYPDFPLRSNNPLTEPVASLRYLMCCNPDYECEKIKIGNDIFEDVQWFIYHGNNYALGAKAGHNGEFHNHNDVGSFMVSRDNEVTLCDTGAGLYTKQYFADETRYSHLLCSSLGHSVPIINGEEQKEGKRGEAQIYEIRDNRFAFNMKHAYVVPSLTSLKREFECDADGFNLTDTFEFSKMPSALCERFVSHAPITIEDGVIKTGGTTIAFNADEFDVRIGSEEVVLIINKPKTIYFVELAPKQLNTNMKLSFRIM